MIAARLRASVLQAAISGKLTDQRPEDGTATELLEQIAVERSALVRAKELKKQKPLSPVSDEDRPFPIPSTWVWTRFGQVTKYAQRGKSPTYADLSPYSAVSQKCVRWSGFDPTAARPYAPEAFIALPQDRKLSAGDVLWNSTGTGTVGRSTVLPASGDYDRMAADSHVTVIRTFPKVLPRFIDIFISSPHIQQNMDDLTSGTTKQQELNLGTILGLPLPLPPLGEQERIVAKLDEVLPLIDQLAELEREREHLDREFAKAIERAILQAAISGKLTKQLPQDGTATELLEAIKTERQKLEKEGKIKKQKPLPSVDKADEPFELPETWAWVRLGEVGSWAAGSTPSRSNPELYGGDIPWVKSGEVKKGRISSTEETITGQALSSCSVRLNPPGSVLVAMYGANIGDTGVLDVAATTNQAVCACIPFIGVDSAFLSYFIGFSKQYLKTQGAGGAQPNISRTKIVDVPFPLAPRAVQSRVATVLDRTIPLTRDLGELVS